MFKIIIAHKSMPHLLIFMTCYLKFHYTYEYNIECMITSADILGYTKEFIKISENERKLLNLPR